jgi:hypothetical protein
MDYNKFNDVHPYVGDGHVAALEAEKALSHLLVNPTRSRKKSREWPS